MEAKLKKGPLEGPFLVSGHEEIRLGFAPRSESFAIEPCGSSLLNFLAIRISLCSIRPQIRRTPKKDSRHAQYTKIAGYNLCYTPLFGHEETRTPTLSH